MGHIAEHVALEFQNLAGTDVRHGKTRAAGPVGQYNCIYEYREEAVGLEAGRMSVALVNHLDTNFRAHYPDENIAAKASSAAWCSRSSRSSCRAIHGAFARACAASRSCQRAP